MVWPLWKTAWKFLKKLIIEPPLRYSKIALLGVYPKKMKTLIQTPMFIATLQPRHGSKLVLIKKCNG